MQPVANSTQICLYCQREFTPNPKSGKQIYCKPSCSVGACNAKKRKQAAQLKQVLADKVDELEALKKAPRSRREVVREVNPAWRLASQKAEAQEQVCQTVIAQERAVAEEKTQLTSTSRGAAMGVGAGLMLGLLPVACAYDARKGRPLSLMFMVVAMAVLLLACLVGCYLGRFTHHQLMTTDPAWRSQLAGIDQQQAQLAKRSVAEQKVLGRLKQARRILPEFTKETVVYAEETVAQGV